MDKKSIYACEEHVDEAIDDLVNNEETFPIMEECKSEKCSYCNKNAKYDVKVNN